MVRNNNNQGFTAELFEFILTPGLTLLANVGLALKQNLKIIIVFFIVTLVSGFIGTGLDCWFYGKSFNYNLNYGKINNLCAIVSITLYLSFIAYRKKRNLGKAGLLSLLPLIGYFIGSALSANSLQPLKMWKFSGGDQTSLLATGIALLVIVVFGIKDIDSEDIEAAEQLDGLNHNI